MSRGEGALLLGLAPRGASFQVHWLSHVAGPGVHTRTHDCGARREDAERYAASIDYRLQPQVVLRRQERS